LCLNTQGHLKLASEIDKDRTQHSVVVLVVICEHSKTFGVPINVRPHTEEATRMTSIPNGIRQSYDAKLKLTVINYAKKIAAIQQESSVVWKKMYDGGKNKSRT